MKKLLSLLLAAVLLVTVSLPAFAADTETPDLSGSIILLHTGDLHGSPAGFAAAAGMKQTLEALGAYVLLVDSGDFLPADTDSTTAAAVIQLMNDAGYDLVCPGDQAFSPGIDSLLALSEAADFAMVDAGTRYAGEALLDAHVIFETGSGTKIGIFGLDTPEAGDAGLQDVSFPSGEELYACAQEQVDELETAGCDYIVCVGHLGMDEASAGSRSIDVLEHVTGIDVWIDGHSGSTLEDIAEATGGTCMVGQTLLTAAGTDASRIGMVILSEDAILAASIAAEDVTVSDEGIAAAAAALTAGTEAASGDGSASAAEEESVSAAETFSDVQAGGWYADYVEYVWKTGLMTGVSDTEFDLDGEVTRQQLATVLYRLAGEPAAEGDLSGYADAGDIADWAVDAMIWAVSEGILTGTSAGLEPGAAATRQQTAVILYRCFGPEDAGGGGVSGAYVDAGEVADWAADAVAWASACGIMTGNSAGELAPADSLTRAALAKILTVVSGL